MAGIGSVLQESIEFSFDDNGLTEAEDVFFSYPTEKIDEIIKDKEAENDLNASTDSKALTGSGPDSGKLKEFEGRYGSRNEEKKSDDNQATSEADENYDLNLEVIAEAIENLEQCTGHNLGENRQREPSLQPDDVSELKDTKEEGEDLDLDKNNESNVSEISQKGEDLEPVVDSSLIDTGQTIDLEPGAGISFRDTGQKREDLEPDSDKSFKTTGGFDNSCSKPSGSGLNANLGSLHCIQHREKVRSVFASLFFLSTPSWMRLTYFAFGVLLFQSGSVVESALTTIPVNTLVSKNQTARIACSSNANQEVHWVRVLTGSTTQQWVYFGENGFNINVDDGRFSIDKDATIGRYDLVIDDVHPKDAGQYTCIDESGIGQRAVAELIIADSMDCKTENENNGVMGYNVFGLKVDSIRMSCGITYKGNIAPSLNWSWPGSEKQSEPPIVTETSTSITSSINLSPTKELNNAKFRCQATVTGADIRDTESRLLWESEPILVRYAEFGETVVKECPGVTWNLICNPVCTYTFEKTADSACKCQYTYNHTSEDRIYSTASVNIACPNSGTDFLVALIAISILLGITMLIAVFFCVLFTRVVAQRKTAERNDVNSKDKLITDKASGSDDIENKSGDTLCCCV